MIANLQVMNQGVVAETISEIMNDFIVDYKLWKSVDKILNNNN